MRVLGLVWVGTRTDEYEATTGFFRDVLRLPVLATETDMTVLELPDGATVEVFGPRCEYNGHLTHPVAGFQVDDARAAAAELEAAGVEIVLPPADEGDRAWVHFRAPDGHVYELVSDPERAPR